MSCLTSIPSSPYKKNSPSPLAVTVTTSRRSRRLSLSSVEGAKDVADNDDNRGYVSCSLLDLLASNAPHNKENRHSNRQFDYSHNRSKGANSGSPPSRPSGKNEAKPRRSSSRRGSRRFSIGSTTDKMMHKQESFGDKDLLTHGDSDHFWSSLVGFACKKGLKPVSPNQDSFLVIRVEGDVSIYGVFDGHGKKGHDVSNFVKEHLPKHLVGHPLFRSDPCVALRDAFLCTQQMLEKTTRDGTLDAAVSGTTCTIVVHFERDEISPTGNQCLYVAHVGDSRCVLAQRTAAGGGLIAVDLTQDHKPELPLERARIIARGGAVHKRPHDVNHRVYVQGKAYPGLAMSRALGDLIGYYDAGVSAEPETSRRELRNEEQEEADSTAPSSPPAGGSSTGGTPFVSPVSDSSRLLPPVRLSNGSSTSSGRGSLGVLSPQVDIDVRSVDRNVDKFLVLCSDGVWEFISSQEAVDFVSQYTPQHSMEAAHDLAKESWRRWIHEEDGTVVDDITSVVIHL